LNNQDYSDNRRDEKSRCNVIPGLFYPAAEADKLRAMIRPVMPKSRRLMEENPGEGALFKWFLRSLNLCYQKTGSPKPQI
jgi:hypothetical protein